MGLFDKLLVKKQTLPPAQPVKPEKSDVPATITVWDNYGRTVEVPREEWRKMLPSNFKQYWSAPDGLANLVVTCLRDGFVAECLEGARQLCRIDPQPHRGATLLGVTLLGLKRFEEAEKVLAGALRQHGEEGSLLTNLAKAISGQGDSARAERTLWRALEVDPNQDNGLLWYAVIQRERGGPSAELDAFRRVAALPASWRAQLWLARHSLETKDVPSALALYQEALQRLKPVTADALMQISGDLGNNGLLKELTEICGPQFDVKQHGAQVGNNLIKAYVELHNTPDARRILEQLYAQQRPDWRELLLFWEREIDKLDKGYGPLSGSEKIEVQLLTFDGPIWAREGTPFSEMLPTKPADAVKIAFFCGSAEVPPSTHSGKIVSQPSNDVGRFSRGLPMFLAERAHIKTSANTMTLVPWLKRGGFVLAGGPWTADSLASIEHKPDYAVLLHIVANREPWQAKFSIVRLIDQKSVAAWEQAVNPNDAAASISDIAKRTIRELESVAEVSVMPTSEGLLPPTIAMLPQYVSGLEQALAVSCSALAPDTRPFLYAERSILDFLLDLCLREPDNVIMRLLLLSTVERESRARPDIAKEYRERLERLQHEHSLPQPSQGLADTAIVRIYAEAES